MDSDRADPVGVVWSGSILIAPILANTNNLFQVCEVDCHIGPNKDSLCTYNCIFFSFPNDLIISSGCSKLPPH